MSLQGGRHPRRPDRFPRQLLAEQSLAGHATVVARVREQIVHYIAQAAALAQITPGSPQQISKPEGADATNTSPVGVLGIVGQTYPPAAFADEVKLPLAA